MNCKDPMTHQVVVSMLERFPNLAEAEWDLMKAHGKRCKKTEELVIEKALAWAELHPEFEINRVQSPPARIA